MRSPDQTVFKRTEKKYLLTQRQYDQIISTVWERTHRDSHKKCTIFNLYFDTPNALLIRRSIDKPVYKEKLRLRTYGIPTENTQVFVEIKKKYKKVVYKRRAKMTYRDAQAFLASGKIPAGYEDQSQILHEIAWFLRFYPGITPSMLVSYDRTAYYDAQNPNLRITFDTNILWRDTHLSPQASAWGNPVLDDALCIMEIKSQQAMPLWLARLLSPAEIYPASFSKYGTAYKRKFQGNDENNAKIEHGG